MDEDPISQFFPAEEHVDLYSVLDLTTDASPDDIKKSYRRLALRYHPDKQTPSTDKAAEATLKFQKISFAYTVISDAKRRKRYDETGRTDEGFEDMVGEEGWHAYFGAIFESVTRQKLDEMKAEYQGSEEETHDLKAAYTLTEGSISEIITHIPHSSHEDEARFVLIITKLIKDGELKSLPLWEESLADEKAKISRKKKGDKEAQEAEGLAKELGVWDEFYGSGKAGQRKGKGKVAASQEEEEEDDVSALQALILKKKERAGSFLNDLAAKYSQPEKKQSKKRKQDDSSSSEPRKRTKAPEAPPPPTDEEFEQLQKKMFSKSKAPSSKGKK
ncbi:DnaJ-domain-containing protein [Pterulicium gracile]|uniref:DnaJ-domain-containing protein n=1 Tax=Pterulicium gracile TaxID=1884261 RepID=A0A5C3R3S2_9AGAR|nr:DnaJ-domain-containing protein [Pterula gracilis]